MEFKSVSRNGVQIPNECKCMWCNGTMRRGGSTHLGAGVNQFTLWCEDCGAITIHAKNFGRKITGFSIQFDYDSHDINQS